MDNNNDLTIELYRSYTPTIAATWASSTVKIPGWAYANRDTTIRQYIAWCSDNCTGKWSYIHSGIYHQMTFYFKNKRDKLAFILTWGIQNEQI